MPQLPAPVQAVIDAANAGDDTITSMTIRA